VRAETVATSLLAMTMSLTLLVFYVDYILDDKNTLYNGCYLNMIIGLI